MQSEQGIPLNPKAPRPRLPFLVGTVVGAIAGLIFGFHASVPYGSIGDWVSTNMGDALLWELGGAVVGGGLVYLRQSTSR